MSRPVTVLFVVPSLGLGGVERALGSVLDRLDRTSFAPALCVLGDEAGELPLPVDIAVTALGRRSALSFPRLVLGLATTIRRSPPDAIVAFSGTANLVVLAAARLLRRPPALVITEHIAPTQMYESVEEPRGALKTRLIRALYPRADAVVAVSRGIADELERRFGVQGTRLRVVHTPVNLAGIVEQAEASPRVWAEGGPVVVAVGRLTPQKNHALLLRALDGLDVSAVIVGDGPERERLEALRDELGLHRVVLAGADANPFPYMVRADAFVLSSDFEGFGVVLVEALALGAPVVSTDCPFGPREILDGGRYGVLVPPGDPDLLREAMRALLADAPRREALRRSGPRRAAAFSAEAATSALEREIRGAVERRRLRWPA